MCGIAGIYSRTGRGIDRSRLLFLRDSMIPRGPDGEGVWYSADGCLAMGQRRLSIIDLSKAAAQPMEWADGRYRIVYNGEIYNYRALRRELERNGAVFRTQGDTEVLLALYAERGQRMLEALRGMFAFVIWDEEKQGLFMARDPFGIKPLYYADDGQSLYWASQVKPLARMLSVTPDPAGHVGFFVLGSVPEPYTLYKEIRALPAGHSLWVDHAGSQITSYCQVSDLFRDTPVATNGMDRETALEQVKESLQDSVQAHLVADVPVGIFLSAGLDSTAIAAMAVHDSDPRLQTFTLGFDEYQGKLDDETGLAATVARRLNTRHDQFNLSRHDFHEELATLLKAMDQPSIDGVNSYFVSKAAARSGCKVALSGLGGDELFASYSSFRDVPRIVKAAWPERYFPGLGRSLRVLSQKVMARYTSPKYASLFEYGRDYGGAYFLRRGLFMPWELPQFLDPEMVREGWQALSLCVSLEKTCAGIISPQAKVSALEMSWYMRNQLLRDADWAGMAHSLEIRVPFIDIEALRRIIPLLPILKTMGKSDIIKHVINSVALPPEIFGRPKTGFSVPVTRWLMADSQLVKAERGYRGWAKTLYQKGGWAL